MSNVPTNLIPTRITGLPEYMGTSTLGYIPYILDGRTYKVQFGQIAAVGAVPSTRVIAAGTGLAGGGDLSENRVISIANGGVGFDQLSATGVVAGSYGSGSEVPVVTVDIKGRVTDISTTPLVITGYVPDSRLISTGAGLLGGGSLASNRTLSVDFSSATPQALGSATAGVSNAAARGDHVHPAVNLSDTNQTQGALPLGRGGTGDALSPVAGAVVYSTGTKFALADPGDPGQVLTSNGSGEPYWRTITGTGTVTNVSVLTANGFSGTVAFADTTPQITLSTTVNGMIKGDGLSMLAAAPGVDYVAPSAYISSGLTMATSRLLGRTDAGTGEAQEITVGTGLSLSAGSLVNSAPDQTVTLTGGTAISISGSYPSFTITNTAPDQVVSLTGAGTTVVTGTYPNFTITSNDAYTGTVTSVAASGGSTGLTFSGSPITTSGTLTLGGTLAVASGGTGATTAAGARTNLGAAASGANSDITSLSGLTGAISSPTYIQYGNGSGTTLAAGRMWYDQTTGSMNVGMGGGNITQQIGEEIFVYGKASAAVTEGQVVVKTGAVGASGVITFAPAPLGTTDSQAIIGVATENIALNGFGRITSFGVVHGINTTGAAYGETWADGDTLYYNPNYVGGLTNVKPSAPNQKTEVGIVINAGSGGSGSIQVEIIHGTSLGGTDNNVQLTTPTNNDLLQYYAAGPYWRNLAPSSVSVGSATTATNLAGGAGGSIPYQSIAGTTTFLASGTGVLTASGGNPSYTMSPSLTQVTVAADPTLALQVATKQYVDTLVASGITYHTPVKYEVPDTTGNLNATYNNGTAGVGATLTNAGTLGAFTPDGTVASVGDRILIYNQTNAAQNGVYTVTTVGNGSTPWVLTRATDANSYALKSPTGLGEGDAFFVTSGATGAGETYVCNTTGTITFGTTPITFVQVSSAPVYTAGTGLTLTGNQFSLTSPVATSLGGTGLTSFTSGGAVYATSTSALTTGTLPLTAGGTGATTAAGARTSLGGTTVGSNFFTLTNPSAITFPQINADNTVSALSAAAFRAAIGAGTGGGSVTSVDVSGGTTGLTTSGGPITSSGTITLAGTLNVANGGTGATSLSSGYVLKGNGTSAVSASVIYDNGTNVGIGTATPAGKFSSNTGASGTYSSIPGNVNSWDSTVSLFGAAGSSTGAAVGIGMTALGGYISSLAPSVAWQNLYYQAGTHYWYNGVTQLGILNTSGDFTALGSARAPIYYDLNNTAYYLDAAGNSVFSNVQNGVNYTSGGGGGRLVVGPGSPYSLRQEFGSDNSGWRYGIAKNVSGTVTDLFYVQDTGPVVAIGDMRAPIFYDSNNTAYYLDAAGNSVFSAFNIGGGEVYFYGSATNAVSIRTGAGGAYKYFTFDASGNFYALNGSVYGDTFYDQANTAYYANPAGTSRLNALSLDTVAVTSGITGLTSAPITTQYADAGTTNTWYPMTYQRAQHSGGYVTHLNTGLFKNTSGWGSGATGWYAAIGGNDSYPTQAWYLTYDGYIQNTLGYVYTSGSFRAPIFYDSNDTGYYVDPAGTSNMSTATINTIYTDTVNSSVVGDPLELCYLRGNEVRIGPGGGNLPIIAGEYTRYAAGTGFLSGRYGGTETNYTTGPIYCINSSSYAPSASSLNSMYGIGYTDGGNSGVWSGGGWGLYVAAGSGARVFLDGSNGIASATASLRAPIFYDSNNTAYFVDPHSTSVMSVVRADTIQFGSGNTAIELNNGMYLMLSDPSGYRTLYLGGSDPASYYNNNTHYFRDRSSNVVFVVNSSYGQHYSSLRAPIFYDSDNTGYYVNPAGTSYVLGEFQVQQSGISGLRIISGTGTQSLWVRAGYDTDGTGTPASSPYNIEFQSSGSSAGTFTFVTGNTKALSIAGDYAQGAGSLRAPIYYDSDNTSYYWNINGGSGSNIYTYITGLAYFQCVFGNNVYSGAVSSPPLQAFSSDGGTAMMSFHRAGAYAVNFGLDPDNYLRIGGWSAGSNRWVLDMSGNNWVASSYRAPIFYDSDNTGYYLDPNSTSNLYGLTVAATISGYVSGCTFSEDSVNRDNITTRTDSGFYQSSTGTTAEGWPLNDNNWQHMISCTHTNDGNYFAMQLGAGFFSQGLFYRSVNNNGSQAWSRLAMYGNNYSSSLYANIYYDSNNTSYYVDADSESVLNTLTLFGELNLSASGINYIDHTGTIYFRNQSGYATSATLTTGGNFTATGNVTAYSDARLKEDVETIGNALDLIGKMRGVTYTRKDTGSKGVGVIAQEMQEVIPQVVEESEDGTLSVAYGNLAGVLIEAIKELKSEVNDLKAKLH